MSGSEAEYWESLDAIDAQMQSAQREKARSYLAEHGDAIQTRVTDLFQLADNLYKHGFFGPSLVFAMTAVDVIVQYIFVKAFSQPLFSLLDDSATATTRSSALQRHYVPRLLQQHGLSIDLLTLRLDSGDLLWDTIVERLWAKRNRIVHTGDSTTGADSELAVLCAKMLWDDVVLPLSTELGLTVKKTHRWCRIQHAGQLPETFDKKDPF
jgi:hypothetical protein